MPASLIIRSEAPAAVLRVHGTVESNDDDEVRNARLVSGLTLVRLHWYIQLGAFQHDAFEISSTSTPNSPGWANSYLCTTS